MKVNPSGYTYFGVASFKNRTITITVLARGVEIFPFYGV